MVLDYHHSFITAGFTVINIIITVSVDYVFRHFAAVVGLCCLLNGEAITVVRVAVKADACSFGYSRSSAAAAVNAKAAKVRREADSD